MGKKSTRPNEKGIASGASRTTVAPERPNPPRPRINQVTGEPMEEEMSESERWTRFGVGLAHTVGSAVVGVYAGPEAGKFVHKEVGKLEEEGLDKAFGKENK